MTKIRRLFLAGTAALFALSATLEAQEAAPDRAAAAKKLFASMDMANLLQASMAEGLEPQMAQFKQMGMSDPGRNGAEGGDARISHRNDEVGDSGTGIRPHLRDRLHRRGRCRR